MGTRERRLRELAEREQLFLDAAREQISGQGLLTLQMAKVARSCDYATGTLYQHFSSKEDLLLAICADQAEKRVATMARAAHWEAPSRDRMFALMVADMLFAERHPDHYRLTQYVFTEAVWGSASQRRRDAVIEAHRPIGDLVSQIVTDGIDAGDVDSRGRHPLEMALGQYAMTIGMHHMVHAEGVLEKENVPDPYRLLLSHGAAHLNGLNWQPLQDPFDDVALDALVTRICSTLFDDFRPAEAERAAQPEAQPIEGAPQ
ncbi:MAG: TetR/AcrR family transcriptional regulator [Alcanivorax sp.]|nr:TetR/AcrR family transcriptional regulator [Alcanivorax sp.]